MARGFDKHALPQHGAIDAPAERMTIALAQAAALTERLELYFAEPSGDAYLDLRRDVAAMDDYARLDERLASLAERLHAGHYEAVCETSEQMMPLWMLSPRVHEYAALAAGELGNWEDAQLSQFMAVSCLEGILATGDGSPQRPYWVTYPGDTQAVVAALGLIRQSQRLTPRGGRFCDVITCDDGTRVWFDVTELVGSTPDGSKDPSYRRYR